MSKFPLGELTIYAASPYIPAGYAPLLLAQSLGYAAAEGLDLHVKGGGTPRGSIKACVEGRGVGFVNTVFNFIVRDEGQPFRSFFSVARQQNRSFAVPVDSPIRGLSELKGKTIALHYPDLLDFAYAALAGEGLDPHADVDFVPLPGSPLDDEQMVNFMKSSGAAAIWQIDHAYGLFEAAGLPLRRLSAPVIDCLTPAACLYARDDILAERPEAFAVLGRAVAKATVFSRANPKAMVEILWRDEPEARPTRGQEAYAMRRDLAVIRDRLALSGGEGTPDPRWGAITLEEMTRWQEFMLKVKGIKTRRDPQEYFCADHVAAFNDFDAEAIVKEALAYKLATADRDAVV